MSNDKWNLQVYLKQLINMGSDNPKDIRLKVSKNDDSYDILKAWFGDMRELTEEKCDADHKIIKVTTSPYMIVHWAMLYGNRFEVLNEDIREEIREEIKKMKEMYDIESYCGDYNENYLCELIRIKKEIIEIKGKYKDLDGTYLDENSDYYKKLVELEKFLKKQDSKAQECGEYIDPDGTYLDENSDYYKKLVKFLNQQEKKYIVKEDRWTYEFKHDYPQCIEATKNGGHILYLRSDQFGFSAPRLNGKLIACDKRYPYWNYLIKSGDEEKKKVENVIKWVRTSRTIGGSFIWPIWEEGNSFSSSYNKYRGVGSYIEDSVDLTLFEVKNYYTSKINEGKDIGEYKFRDDVLWTNELNKVGSTMVKWLNHFGNFNKFIDYFLMDDFVKKHEQDEYIPIDITTGKELTEKDRKSYKKEYKRIMDMEPDALREMLNLLEECIEKRSKNMIKVIIN